MPPQPAAFPPDFQPPKYWEKRIAAAYLRLLGMSQAQAAVAVGRHERTLWTWEQEPSWALAQQLARARWLGETGDAARRAVLKQLEAGDGELGLKLLERLDPALAPPKHKVDVDFTARVVRLPEKAGSTEAWQASLPPGPDHA